MKILLVEDECDLLEIFSEFLQQLGHEVSEAENGKVALEKLKLHHPYDLIIVDNKMPIMTGEELVLNLRSKIDYRPAIVMWSASGELPHDVAKHIDHFFHKPLDIYVFEKTIEEIESKILKPAAS